MVYVAPSVAAVRALWDRSGLRAGPAIGAQLSAFADALIVAHAARERAAEVLVGNWLDAPRWPSDGEDSSDEMLKSSAHPRAAGVAVAIERVLVTH